MAAASCVLGTSWRDGNPLLPLCARYWVLLGDEDRCYWRPGRAVLAAAGAAYAGAAVWWYRGHAGWRYRGRTVVAVTLLGACASSMVGGMAWGDILRNTLPRGVFCGLIIVGVLDHFYGR